MHVERGRAAERNESRFLRIPLILLQVDFITRTCDVMAPVMLIDWVFLIDVQFEELVMNGASEVFVPGITG